MRIAQAPGLSPCGEICSGMAWPVPFKLDAGYFQINAGAFFDFREHDRLACEPGISFLRLES